MTLVIVEIWLWIKRKLTTCRVKDGKIHSSYSLFYVGIPSTICTNDHFRTTGLLVPSISVYHFAPATSSYYRSFGKIKLLSSLVLCIHFISAKRRLAPHVGVFYQVKMKVSKTESLFWNSHFYFLLGNIKPQNCKSEIIVKPVLFAHRLVWVHNLLNAQRKSQLRMRSTYFQSEKRHFSQAGKQYLVIS